MKDNRRSSEHTLLMSTVLSSPSPLVVGLSLLFGRSATQIADFVRRSAELMAIVVALAVYEMTTRGKSMDADARHRLERHSNIFVGAMMATAGAVMAAVSLFINTGEKGNVIPGLVIASIGAVANSLFWMRYTSLNNREPNPILAVQARLYRAKALVDISVTLSLSFVLGAPGTPIAFWFDLFGTIVVSIYLMWSGAKTIYDAKTRRLEVPDGDIRS
jgi:divalent metal cation (Fe/Co/Zn/Cd) transporter